MLKKSNVVCFLLVFLTALPATSLARDRCGVSYDRWGLREADNNLSRAFRLLDSVNSCYSSRDWRICRDANDRMEIAREHIRHVVDTSRGSNCYKCRLDHIVEYGKGMDRFADELYRKGFKTGTGGSGAFTWQYKSIAREQMRLKRCKSEIIDIPPSLDELQNDYIVWVHPKNRTCCRNMGKVVGRLKELPYAYHGTQAKQVKSGAIRLKAFKSKKQMLNWVCNRKVTYMAYGPVQNHAKINGYDVTRLPCKPGNPGKPR